MRIIFEDDIIDIRDLDVELRWGRTDLNKMFPFEENNTQTAIVPYHYHNTSNIVIKILTILIVIYFGSESYFFVKDFFQLLINNVPFIYNLSFDNLFHKQASNFEYDFYKFIFIFFLSIFIYWFYIKIEKKLKETYNEITFKAIFNTIKKNILTIDFAPFLFFIGFAIPIFYKIPLTLDLFYYTFYDSNTYTTSTSILFR